MKTLLLTIILFVCLPALFAQEATLWRGENSLGMYKVDNLIPEWPADGLQIIWTFDKLGQGFSSPVFANNSIYINGMIDGQAVLFVLDMNGKVLKELKYGKEFDTSYPGTRSSPTIIGDLAYLFTGLGKIVCLNHKSGAIVWAKDLLSSTDGQNLIWGYTETIVVDGDKIYTTPGGKKNNVMALNRFNGETIWNCEGLGELSAYCTPLIVNLPSRKLLVTHTHSNVIGVDTQTGKLLWNFPHPNQWAVHPNTPIYSEGKLFVFSGYGQGGELLSLSADGSSVKKEWEIKSFDSRMGGAVLIDGYLYGSGDKDRTWQCIDWKTGEKKYSTSEVGKGVAISANKNIIGYSEKGELFMAKADPSGFKLLGNVKVTLGSDQHWAHPVIYNNILYLRHGNVLIAYKIAA